MKAFFFYIVLSLIFIQSRAQTSPDLVGNWYAKPYAHQKNLSKATLYIRNMLPNSKESLNIDSAFHYTYKQWYSADTLINKGTIDIHGDTLFFLQRHSSSRNVHSQDTIKLYLYYAGNAQLIYSYYQLPRRANKVTDDALANDSSNIFTRVETGPEYKPGENSFYKTIYRQLAKNVDQPSASALLEFKIIIDKTGNIEPNSVEPTNEFSKQYLAVVAEALKNLEGNFTPGLQNGRTVRSYFHFHLNY